MYRTSPEQQLLKASRTQRQLFQLRFLQYSPFQRYLTSEAVVDYANKLSARIGRMPDAFIFGRETLSSTDAELFLLAMTHFEAEEPESDESISAILALRAIANLVALRHMPAPPSVRMQAVHAFDSMMAIMDEMMSQYVLVRDAKARLN